MRIRYINKSCFMMIHIFSKNSEHGLHKSTLEHGFFQHIHKSSGIGS